MTQIILTPDQSVALESSRGPVVFLGSDGKQLAVVTPRKSLWTPEQLAEMERRLHSDEPRVPSSEVLARLRELERQACDTP